MSYILSGQCFKAQLTARPLQRVTTFTRRHLHASSAVAANPASITRPGPPPTAPLPAASQYGQGVDRRRRQAELIKRGQEKRTEVAKPASALKKRFWKDVHVQTEQDGAYIVHLDTRPVRNAMTKSPLQIPSSKPQLATAIALEWELLTSAQQALRPHLIPLTSIASRAYDLALQDAAAATSKPPPKPSAPQSSTTLRDDIIMTLLLYLDTDTLLCWAPPPPRDADTTLQVVPSLRELQIATAEPIISYLTSSIWPGVHLDPGLDSGSIIPAQQPPETRDIVRGWLAGLDAWELVGLERAVLAGKSLCLGARLLCEWGESFADVRKKVLLNGSSSSTGAKKEEEEEEEREMKRFGIEEAATACSLEVTWQTGRWGEVEDTHDVEKEDVRRQFGSAILVMGGTNM
ncbi:MAG: hypothetical protein L6R35_005405 [Caloplaca aegaea]|nr:MAG: hypothetical protein L6R35_005405 [Caloplaca aegaea]